MISEKDKKELIEKLNKPFSLIGKEIPDKMSINGEELELSNIVLNLIRKRVLSEEEIKIVHDLKKILLKKELDDEKNLKDSNLTEEEAKNLYEGILGIKRAILALEGAGKEKKNLKNTYKSDDVEDMKRWIEFLKKVR